MAFLDKLAQQFSKTSSREIGSAIEDLVSDAIMRRRSHERRWYDNQFFDDGYHFRVISRKTGRVIDHAYQNSGYVERAIPRASRQIRAVSNLLFAADPYPVVYPERISIESFRLPDGSVDQQSYETAREGAKTVARKQGVWISTEWENLDLPLKLIDMLLTAAKTSVSWIQIYSDTQKQKLIADVYDGFDIICYGDRRDAPNLPFLTKTCPTDLNEVLKDPRFDPKKVKELTPDNRYATSEIKEAYMRVRYGTKIGTSDKSTGSIIVKESFLKEMLTESNWKNAVDLGNDTGAMDGKSKGDSIMRHVFSAGGVTLKDEYVDYDEYPLVPFRFEPGPMYQVPYIERFIPQNKSLDVIITRMEKWINAMIVGVYQKRKTENFQISNFPGGQIVEYETTPLTQMQTGSVGATPFNIIELLNKFIDEQGSTTAGGINVPQGVKSGVAIESVKSTEYANLKISTLMLKKTIKDIAERMIERADKDFLEPQEVTSIEDGEPNYFDVIGQRGMELSQKVNKPLPHGVIPISRKAKVRIEIEPGLGLTMEGKKTAMQEIINFMIQMASPPLGIISIDALKMVVKRFLETFGYGSTEEFMEAMDEGLTQQNLDEDQMKKMQIAMLQALKDSGAVGPELQKNMVDSTKVGVLESLKESGIMDNLQQPKEPPKESISIAYKDAPPSIQRQMEQAAGFTPATDESPSETVQKVKKAEVIGKLHQTKVAMTQPKGGQNGRTQSKTA